MLCAAVLAVAGEQWVAIGLAVSSLVVGVMTVVQARVTAAQTFMLTSRSIAREEFQDAQQAANLLRGEVGDLHRELDACEHERDALRARVRALEDAGERP